MTIIQSQGTPEHYRELLEEIAHHIETAQSLLFNLRASCYKPGDEGFFKDEDLLEVQAALVIAKQCINSL